MSLARNIADRGHKILAYGEISSGNSGTASNLYNISSVTQNPSSAGNGVYQWNFATTLTSPANYHVFVQMITDQGGQYFIRCTNRTTSNFTIKLLYEGSSLGVHAYPHSCVVIGESD
jgi:hypothetical protein